MTLIAVASNKKYSTDLFYSSKLIKVCKCDPEFILFEVRNAACKIWKLQLIKVG